MKIEMECKELTTLSDVRLEEKRRLFYNEGGGGGGDDAELVDMQQQSGNTMDPLIRADWWVC